MGDYLRIIPPSGDEDRKGAQRALDDFLVLYQPTLTRIEHHLETLVEDTQPTYTDAYRPWLKGLHDLLQGAYLMARNIPLPDPEGFIDAIRMFSFESAICFLQDLCLSCKITLEQHWAKTFREHIDILLFSVFILNRQNQQQLAH